MDAYRPLGAALFFYECLRLLLLVVFIFLLSPAASMSAASIQEAFAYGAFFPYLVYLSPNALFPLMALFIWLSPGEYRNYLSLYMAGKIIMVVLFFVWELISSRQFGFGDDLARSIFVLGGSTLLSLTDILAVWGAWTLKNKYRGGV